MLAAFALVGCAHDNGTEVQHTSAPVSQAGSTPRTVDAIAPTSSHTDATATLNVDTNIGHSHPTNGAVPTAGRTLFLHNCAHCHGADASGDEGPDLHHLDLSDQWIANRIRNGKAGQMTAFKGKLKPEEITALVAYVQGLK